MKQSALFFFFLPSFFFFFFLLACLPRQRYYVTGNSMCPSLRFDNEHRERFHCNIRHSKEGHCHMPAALLIHDCYTFRHPCHVRTYAQLPTHQHGTEVMCDYRVELKKKKKPVATIDVSRFSARVSLHMPATRHSVNKSTLPEALSHDGDVYHCFFFFY